MKRFYKVLTVSLATVALVACGTGDKEEEEKGNANEENKEKEELTVEDVYTEAQDVLKDTESYNVEVNFEQDVTTGDGTMETETFQNVDLNLDTSEFELEGTEKVNSDEMGIDESGTLEMYSKEDEVYYRDSFINEWLIFKDDNVDLLLEKFYTEPNPDELYENLKEHKEDFDFEDSGDKYVLSIDVSEDEYSDVQDDIIDNAVQQDETGIDTLDETEIDKFKIDIEVNKDTLETEKITQDMELSMNVYEEDVTIAQEAVMDFDDYNNIDDIEVPEDIKEDAEEANETDVGSVLQR